MIVSAILAALVLASAHARERIEPSNGACAFELDEQNAPPCCAQWGFEKFGPGRLSWPFYKSSGCTGGMIFQNDQEIIDWPNNQAAACGDVGVCLSKGYYRKVEVEVDRIEPSNGACAFELDAQNAPPCCAQWGFEKFGPGRLSWPFYKSSGCTGGMTFQNDQEIIDWPNNQAAACGDVGVCLSKGYYRKVEVEVESSNPSPPPPPRQRIEPSNGACAFELDAQNAPPCCAQWGFEKFGPGRLSWPFYKSSGCTGGMIFQNDQEIIDWPNNQAAACGDVGVCLSKGYYRKVEVESKGLRGGNISLE